MALGERGSTRCLRSAVTHTTRISIAAIAPQAAGMLDPEAVDGDGNPIHAVFSDEADAPQHCGDCDEFMENALTPTGVSYVIEALQRFEEGRGKREALSQWADFYADEITGKADVFFCPDMDVEATDLDERILGDLLECGTAGQDALPRCNEFAENHCVVAHPDISNHLLRYCAWNEDEVLDHKENVRRMIWLLGTTFGAKQPFYANCAPRLPPAPGDGAEQNPASPGANA